MVDKKALAIVSMVRGDHHWAKKFVGHYSAEVADLEDIHVIINDNDQVLERIFEGCTVYVMPELGRNGSFDRERLRHQHKLIKALIGSYIATLVVDIDEFVVCDRKSGHATLHSYLSETYKEEVVRSCFGCEVIQVDELEKIDLNKPVLNQRRNAFVSAGYCKPNVFYKNFGRANHHRVSGQPWIIDPMLWLFHLRFCDKGLAKNYYMSRKAYSAEQSSNNGVPVGGWSFVNNPYDNEVKRLRGQKRVCELDDDTQSEIIERFVSFYNEKGRVGARRNITGLYRVPDRFLSLL